MYGLSLSVSMKVWEFCVLFVFLLWSSTLGEDTVAEDVGVHQLERLVELLTPKECEDLLFALSHPEEDIFQHIDRLSPENNQLDLNLRVKRDKSSAVGSGAACQAALTDWLLKYGEKTYYDRLSRGLQHIGRTDIAIEVGKNINQDKVLNLKRYVEDYHKYVSSLNIQPANADSNTHRHQRIKKTKLTDLTWRDLDLVLERAPVPPYPRSPLDVVLPVMYGILLGFGGTLLAGLFLLLVINRSSERQQSIATTRHHQV
ncbi:transmembrane and death domain protein 1-like [Nematolebias whitei]|uniref:transmembrane and death domain protein 1-like n=1 Tax=Nematolebias whitei TaxID=451745 RepID=UPI00189B1D3F|nr:transmembrane and death domain protein 1-like [Nematolebias whitei]